MNLTPEHIVELVLYRHYSDKYSYASKSSISEASNELISEGLLTVLKRNSTSLTNIVISERGRQALLEVGSAVIICTLCELDKKYLLDLCNDPLVLADLPILLVSGNEQVRALARRIYQEWR